MDPLSLQNWPWMSAQVMVRSAVIGTPHGKGSGAVHNHRDFPVEHAEHSLAILCKVGKASKWFELVILDIIFEVTPDETGVGLAGRNLSQSPFG